MANIEEFSSKSFNVTDWINSACASRPEEEAPDRFLAELEMKLQLNCEDLEVHLEDCTSQVLRRIPFVMQEISRMQGEMKDLQSGVVSLAKDLKRERNFAEDAVSGIKDADRVKRNMEAACNTLKEATDLSDLFARVDGVFAKGNVTDMAEVLSTMRRSLALVSDVPEFRGGNEKIKVLEESLVARIGPRLADALAAKQGEQVKELSGLLLSVDRYSTLEQLYASARAAQFKEIVQTLAAGLEAPSTTPAGFSSLLSDCQDGILATVESELQWCDSVLPENSSELVLRMLKVILEEVNGVIHSSLARLASLPTSLMAQQTTLAFFHSLARTLAPVTDLEGISAITSLLFQPFESEVRRYAVLEKEELISTVEKFSSGVEVMEGEREVGVEAMVSKIVESVGTMFKAGDEAVERCMGFTGGTELGSLLPAMDSALDRYYLWLLSSLKTIRSKSLGGAAGGPGSPADMASVLQLLRVSCRLEDRIGDLTKKLRDALVGLAPKLKEAASDIRANLSDLATSRLQGDPASLKSLITLVSDAEALQFSAIPLSERAHNGFKAASEALVFDVLMRKLRENMSGLAKMPEWSKGAMSSGGVNLPQFSAYALPYVTSSGEYLMVLPQQLEALVGGEGEEEKQLEEEEELAGIWLDKIVSGAAELYADEILQIPSLTAQGCAQLAADVQYFGNILSAMGFAPSEDLNIIEKALGMSTEELKQAAGVLNPTGRDVVWVSMGKKRGVVALEKPAGKQ
ncbi:hypothetical protein BSKO_13870 [Bryopsis sp. KO-2023]|nr:hypothetical protein BSKO_13870 [Bryopsis sp. KO-2023]